MSVAGYAKTLESVLEALEAPALIVGHSMGALIALELACHRPDRVCGVAALNAVFQRSPTAAAAVRARAESLTGDGLPDPAPTLTRWFGTSDTPARRACTAWLRSVDPRGYKWAYSAFAQTLGPEPRDLHAIACPVLYATGADEPNSTPEMSQRMAQETPNALVLIVDGAAHMLPMTHPDTTNEALRRLAARVWPAPSGPKPDTAERS
jgi:pimeloyl-ACP methyl ester carboxylesterase